jgi:cephalosporin hydroxylase
MGQLKYYKEIIMEHFYLNIQGWFNFQELYTKVVSELSDNSHVVEVGAWKGCSTAYLAVEIINSGKNIKLDVVDTWEGSKNEEGHVTDPDIIKYNGNIFSLFQDNLKPVLDRINPIQSTSVDASKLYEDKSLDFVFVDANHSYEDVKKDIDSWLPKIKSGGYIGGHDYNANSWPGVIRAVNESFARNEFVIIGESWLVKRG